MCAGRIRVLEIIFSDRAGCFQLTGSVIRYHDGSGLGSEEGDVESVRESEVCF